MTTNKQEHATFDNINENIEQEFNKKYVIGKYQEALNLVYENQINIDDSLELALKVAAAHFAISRKQVAIEFLERIYSKYPNDIRVSLDLANFSRKAGSFSDARKWIGIALKLNPRNMWPYYYNAQLCRDSGDIDGALNILEAGLDNTCGHVTRSEYESLLKDYCDAVAIKAELNKFVSCSELTAKSTLGRPLDNCVYVGLVKNEADIINFSLNRAFNLGFRYFVIADNGSTDNTLSEIHRFKREHPEAIMLLLDDPIQGYYQDAKTTGLAKLGLSYFGALGNRIEWVFPFDADEVLALPADGPDLYSLLSSEEAQRAKLIVYHWMHAFAISVYDSLPDGANMDLTHNHYSSFGTAPVRKVAFRYEHTACIEVGNHFVSNIVTNRTEILHGSVIGIVLIHYPVRSASQLKSKILNGYAALQAGNLAEKYGGHWRRDYNSFLVEGDAFFLKKVEVFNDIHGRNGRAI